MRVVTFNVTDFVNVVLLHAKVLSCNSTKMLPIVNKLCKSIAIMHTTGVNHHGASESQEL